MATTQPGEYQRTVSKASPLSVRPLSSESVIRESGRFAFVTTMPADAVEHLELLGETDGQRSGTEREDVERCRDDDPGPRPPLVRSETVREDACRAG